MSLLLSKLVFKQLLRNFYIGLLVLYCMDSTSFIAKIRAKIKDPFDKTVNSKVQFK